MRLRPLVALTALPVLLALLPAVPAQAAKPVVTVDRAPAALAGVKTGLTSVLDVETDRDGRIYALTPTKVRVFASSARGNVAPARSITLSPPNDEVPVKLAVDGTGWLYVLSTNSDFGLSTVTVFEPRTSTPAGTYSGTDLGLGLPSDLTGVGSQVAITDVGDSDVKIYSLHAGDTTLARRLAAGSGSPTKIDLPTAIDSDRAGRLVLSGSNWASVFRPGADSVENPSTAPVQYVQGSRTGLGSADRGTTGVGLDARGRLVVASVESSFVEDPDTGDIRVVTRNPRVFVYAARATGNVAPQAILRGSRSRLGVLSGLEVAPSGALLTHRFDRAAGTWAAGLSVHRPLGPYAAPGRPAPLRVTGATDAGQRVVRWRTAATNPDTPVRSYLVTVDCGAKRVLAVDLSGSKRAATIRLRDVTRGTCTARVRARNVLGTGPIASTTFRVAR